MLVFNGNAKPEIWLASCIYKTAYYLICKSEIIGFGIVFIGIKISEKVGNINVKSAAKPTANIVEA